MQSFFIHGVAYIYDKCWTAQSHMAREFIVGLLAAESWLLWKSLLPFITFYLAQMNKAQLVPKISLVKYAESALLISVEASHIFWDLSLSLSSQICRFDKTLAVNSSPVHKLPPLCEICQESQLQRKCLTSVASFPFHRITQLSLITGTVLTKKTSSLSNY